MAEPILKYVVSEVNKLLDTNFNMISFDSLSKSEVLQVIINCLNVYNVFPKLDVEGNSDEVMGKLIKFLVDIKAPMPLGVTINEFTDGIIEGKRNILQSTFHWILSNPEEIKKRSYFAKYLIKVQLIPSMINDPDVEILQEQYDELIQEFKNVHSQATKYSKLARATSELRSDIEKQTKDIANIQELIEKQKGKLDNIPNKEMLLVSVKSMRSELLAQKLLVKQLEEQAEVKSNLESTLTKCLEALSEQRTLNEAKGGPLNRLMEELQTDGIIILERLPQEMHRLEKQAALMERIALDSEPTDLDMADVQEKVNATTIKIQDILDKTMLRDEPRDEKLAQFRQHAVVIANNKQVCAETFMELKEEMGLVRRQVEDKETDLQNIVGGSMPQGEDLKRFVSKLRAQSVIYKERRAQLLEIQSEVGVLARTQDILFAEDVSLAEAIKNRDSKDITKEEEVIPDDITELQQRCQELVAIIKSKKSELLDMRQEIQDKKLTEEEFGKKYEEAKTLYDTALSSYNKDMEKLELEIVKLEKMLADEEEKWKKVRRQIDDTEEMIHNLNHEGSNFGDKNSHTEILKEQLKEEEMKKQELEENINNAATDKEKCEDQVNLWFSTLKLLECKKQLQTKD